MAFAGELLAAHGDRVRLYPQDECGLLDLDALLASVGADTLVYCCGPAGLIDAIEQRHAAGALRVERFTPLEIDSAADASFEVELQREEGLCGTCETRVLAGAVEHRDTVLTGADRATNAMMMICVSRAAGARLVLDL
jgi:Flavodoxin reductases (ferredoxin-NADPH reductases) family 1